MQDILRRVQSLGVASLASCRLACKRMQSTCDRVVVSHTLALDHTLAQWQLLVIERFSNLRDLRVDLRHSCAEAHKLYGLLASIVHCAPELQTLHVLCGRSDSEGRLALPSTGVCASDLCSFGWLVQATEHAQGCRQGASQYKCLREATAGLLATDVQSCSGAAGNKDLHDSLLTLRRLQRLQFGGQGLATCGADVLRSAVEHAPLLQQLVVNFAISNAGVVRLAPGLSQSGALSSLCLSAAAVGDAGAAALALPLAHNTSLVELDLSRVRISTAVPVVTVQCCLIPAGPRLNVCI